MEKVAIHTSLNPILLPHHTPILKMMLLLKKIKLDATVKTHCKRGLSVITLIKDHEYFNTGLDLLSGNEFDAFYRIYPGIYFKNRASIPPIMIIENIDKCIKANKIFYVEG